MPEAEFPQANMTEYIFTLPEMEVAVKRALIERGFPPSNPLLNPLNIQAIAGSIVNGARELTSVMDQREDENEDEEEQEDDDDDNNDEDDD